MNNAIQAEGLRKKYDDKEALCGVDLAVPAGSVLALLGPNGAGKTTAIRILTTLLKADGGTASVAGFDVVRDAHEVRKRIGLTGQYAAVDARLSGRQNLKLIGVLHGLSRSSARARADELLETFELTDATDLIARKYSGGMRRRLDLAAALVVNPAVLFLDEPTSGLDPVGRQVLWRTVRDHVAAGVAVLLTTQYLEEADQLADRVVVIDHGQVIADGTADELKSKVGGDRLEVAVPTAADVPDAAAALARVTLAAPVVGDNGRRVSVPMTGGVSGIAAAAVALREAGVEVTEFAVRRPSLVDVFVAFTGAAKQEG